MNNIIFYTSEVIMTSLALYVSLATVSLVIWDVWLHSILYVFSPLTLL